MPFRFLDTRRQGPVEYLTLNRPDVRNAFNEQVIDELTRWAAGAAADRELRAIVLAGAGPTFCAGADLGWMKKVAEYTPEENVRDAEAMAGMYAALDRLPVPLIGRVQGAAIGGGAGLVSVCDVVVAEPKAVFGFTEVKLGILPAAIAPYVLRKIGTSAARALFLTGRRFDAARAREIGLVHAVVEGDRIDDAVADYVREILGAGPEAVAAAKGLIETLRTAAPDEMTGITAGAIAERRASAEGREGLAAFLEKRRASWNVSPDPDRQSR